MPTISSSGESGICELRRSPGVSGSNAADALHQRLAGDVAEDHAAKSLLQIAAGGLGVFGDDDAAAVGGFKQRSQAGHVRPQRSCKENDGTGEGGDGVHHPVQVGALGNDAQIFVHGQNLGGASTENCL